MKLVLRSDVDQVGKKGDIVDVADGYGRNFLVPKGLAFQASAGRRGPGHRDAPQPRRPRRQRPGRRRGGRQALVPKVVTITARAGAEGKLFGSVTTAEIADAVAAQTGVELDRRQLHLDEPIKTLGTHLVPAKLHAEVEFPITVEVVAS